jgi:hypothetical protein
VPLGWPVPGGTGGSLVSSGSGSRPGLGSIDHALDLTLPMTPAAGDDGEPL